MADTQERRRDQEPEREGTYDKILAQRRRRLERQRQGRIILKGRDLPWDLSRQGRIRFYTDPNSYGDENTPFSEMPALTEFKVFVHEIRTRSGRHKHQGGLVIYVIEGQGYTDIDGEKVEWKTGDLLLLPVRPGGVEHQHFNTGEHPAQWLAFRYQPFHDALGEEVVQVLSSPEFVE